MAEQRVGRYRLLRKVLAGDASRGVPEVWQASDAGDIYYVKLWPRQSDESSAIRALWNREVRSLTRLQGYPSASELFVKLRGLDATDKYYYAVFDGGRRLLLSEILSKRNLYTWLSNLGEVGRRRPLWEGLQRVAEALSILHNDGTLHRSIAPAAVLAGPEGQGDFRLSGFEWSLRLAGQEGAASQVGQRNTLLAPELDGAGSEYSPGTDWFDFGLVAAELFGVAVKQYRKRAGVRDAVQQLATLREKEKQLIISLLAEDAEKRLSNAEEVIHSIRSIVSDLNVATASTTRKLVLAVRLTPELDLQRIVETASAGAAPASDPVKQVEWIRQDLKGDVRVAARAVPSPHFILKGIKLEYRVRQWTVDTLTTWDVGYCEYIEQTPRFNIEDQYFSLGERSLDVQLYPQVRRNIRTVRDRAAPWDKIFPFRKERAQLPSHLRNIHDFFRITQQLDTVLTAAQICPVSVVSQNQMGDHTIVEVTPFDEPERSNLARHLGLQSPSEQLKDWFRLGAEEVGADDEDDPRANRYSLLDRRSMGSDTTATIWRFEGAYPHKAGPRYQFLTQSVVSLRQQRLYLARDHGGTLTQIRRRHKAIEDMRSQEGLLQIIASPRDVSHSSEDPLPVARADFPLDGSKLKALEAIWKTQPSFAIQGPPGTGKTTLIQGFADRLFGSDLSAQILLTAHSHHTVDDVRAKLSRLFETLPPRERPILLRLGSKQATEHDLGTITSSLIRTLSASALKQDSPAFLRSRIDAMAKDERRTKESDVDVRTMETLVQEAANLTFSTSNSAELADLAGRGRRFDWSIIEEAGKAHGFDMAVALQESHRLLLIGDHQQLPPFNVKIFKDLLGNPLRIRKAIQTGAQFAPGLVDPSIVDEEEGRMSFEDRCSIWRRMVMLFASIFESSVGDAGETDGPAATLTDQHRMHPDIAELVGKIFYPSPDGGTILKSPKDTHEKFSKPSPFEIVKGSWMPPHRIVWCDVPWIQKVEFAEGEVDGLFASEREADLVVKALQQFAPRDSNACEVQILSPYNDQLHLIRRAIERANSDQLLPNMFKDPFDLKKAKRMGATVDEFQGSEADVVIVSLVRNNALVPWKSVGFLKEANRMNVLLSRARHKLIIVGSWDFFVTRCNEHTSSDDEHSYIGEMMRRFDEARKAGRLGKVNAIQ